MDTMTLFQVNYDLENLDKQKREGGSPLCVSKGIYLEMFSLEL